MSWEQYFWPSVYGPLDVKTMVIARCFWALIKFIVAYLLASAIAHLLVLDMLVMSYIRCALYLVKFLVLTFFSLRQQFASRPRWFCYSIDLFELCSCLLQGSYPLSFFFFLFVCLFGFVSNLHPSGWNLVTWPFLLWHTPF